MNITVLQVGNTWAFISWIPPATSGSIDFISNYAISSVPQPTNYSTDSDTLREAEIEIPMRNFTYLKNSACVEIQCEELYKIVSAATTSVNLTELVPAINYSVSVFVFSNGSNLQSRASQQVQFTTETNGKGFVLPFTLFTFQFHSLPNSHSINFHTLPYPYSSSTLHFIHIILHIIHIPLISTLCLIHIPVPPFTLFILFFTLFTFHFHPSQFLIHIPFLPLHLIHIPSQVQFYPSTSFTFQFHLHLIHISSSRDRVCDIYSTWSRLGKSSMETGIFWRSSNRTVSCGV